MTMGFLDSIGSSISDIASSVVDDLSGAGLDGTLGSIASLAFGGADGGLIGEVGQGLVDLGNSLLNAGGSSDGCGDAGGISAPMDPSSDAYDAGYDAGWDDGYADGSATSPTDTGVIGTDPTTISDPSQIGSGLPTLGNLGTLPTGGLGLPTGGLGTPSTPSTPVTSAPNANDATASSAQSQAASTLNNATATDPTDMNDFDNIMNSNAPIETKIMALMMKLQHDQRDKVMGDINKVVQDKKAGDSGSSATGDQQASMTQDNEAMQMDMQDLNEMSSMTTNMMKMVHDMNSSVIQNMR
jgi:hypothetical protein